MLLEQLLSGTVYAVLKGSTQIEISEIVSDSRKVTLGCALVCISGNHFDGHSTICQSLAGGACAIIVEKLTGEVERVLQRQGFFTIILVDSTKRALNSMWNVQCQSPLTHLHFIGITGTKGKTTTSFLLQALLQGHQVKTGLIGTNGIFDGENWQPNAYTTPEAETLFPALQRMMENRCEIVVMEVSSIGMKQNRLAGIFFDYAIFTNFYPDHIGGEEHQSLEEYFYWKRQLFLQCRHAILFDCLKGREIGKSIEVPVDYVSVEKDEMKPALVRGIPGVSVVLNMEEIHPISLMLPMPGEYNVENAALATFCCAKVMRDAFLPELVPQILQHSQIPGRMEAIYVGEFAVFIDYAHNGESLKKLLSTLRQYHPKQLICLFGCGGNRSHERRYQMGEVSGSLADYSILTSDNSREENPLDIIKQIEKGVLKSGGNYEIIVNRKEAIETCIQQAKSGDWIVLAGKGHEEYMEVKGQRFPFSEKEIVKAAIARRKQEEVL